MALKSSREGLRKELVDYLGNIIIDDNLRNEIIKVVGDNFVTSESLNETVNNLTMQITTESGERVEADTTLQNNITAEATAREGADTTLQNNINAESTARQESISNIENLINNGVLKVDLLWSNASPSSAFDVQTINLDLSKYSCAIILFSSYAGRNEILNKLSRIGTRDTVIDIVRRGTATSFISSREYYVTDNKIEFYQGAHNYIDISKGYSSDDNASCVPIQIYGIR